MVASKARRCHARIKQAIDHHSGEAKIIDETGAFETVGNEIDHHPPWTCKSITHAHAHHVSKSTHPDLQVRDPEN